MPTRAKGSKYAVNFQNWVLGGSLLSITSTESDTRRGRSSSRRVVIAEADSDGNEIPASEAEYVRVKRHRKGKEVDAKLVVKEASKIEETKKDADTEKAKEESKPKKKCKCGNDVDGPTSPNEDKSNDGGDKSEKSDAEKNSGDKGTGGGAGWTDEQDTKIKEMKGGDKSWKDIAAAVGASKSDVQKRFKELLNSEKEGASGSGEGQGVQMSGGNGGVDDAGMGEMDFGGLFDDFGSGNTGGSGWGGGGGSGWVRDDNAAQDTGNGSSWDADQVQELKKSKENKDTGGYNRKGKKKGKAGGRTGGSNEHNWKGGDDGGAQDNTYNGDTQSNSSNGGAQGNNNWSCEAPNDNPSPPPQEEFHGRLQENNIWSRDDCETLEMLEERYREHKWLHIQAEFFNWTGRMIAAELIENKFRDDGAA